MFFLLFVSDSLISTLCFVAIVFISTFLIHVSNSYLFYSIVYLNFICLVLFGLNFFNVASYIALYAIVSGGIKLLNVYMFTVMFMFCLKLNYTVRQYQTCLFKLHYSKKWFRKWKAVKVNFWEIFHSVLFMAFKKLYVAHCTFIDTDIVTSL